MEPGGARMPQVARVDAVDAAEAHAVERVGVLEKPEEVESGVAGRAGVPRGVVGSAHRGATLLKALRGPAAVVVVERVVVDAKRTSSRSAGDSSPAETSSSASPSSRTRRTLPAPCSGSTPSWVRPRSCHGRP